MSADGYRECSFSVNGERCGNDSWVMGEDERLRCFNGHPEPLTPNLLRRMTLRVVIRWPGGTFEQIEKYLLEMMQAEDCDMDEWYPYPGRTISSLSYDGFIYIADSGGLYPANYPADSLPWLHRLPGVPGWQWQKADEHLMAELEAASSRPYPHPRHG